MNIDSLPLTAFVLECSGAGAMGLFPAHTLTLKQPNRSDSALDTALAGSVSLVEALTAPTGCRVMTGTAVPGLTLTF